MIAYDILAGLLTCSIVYSLPVIITVTFNINNFHRAHSYGIVFDFHEIPF